MDGQNTDEVITWLFEEDSFAPIGKLQGSTRQSILTDHLGTPLEMVDQGGGRRWAAQTTAYGRIRLSEGTRAQCPFRFQGQYEDTETGLYYNRFRYYDPQEGGYISQDPIRTIGNNPIFYAYVDDPNSFVDIWGWACVPFAGNPQQAHAVIKSKWGSHMTPADMRELHNTIDRIKTNSTRYSQDGSVFSNSHTISPNSQRLNTIGGYEEWTVKTPGLSNRGERRIVLNRKANKAYYSHDHYDSFIEIDLNGWN